MTFVKIFVSSSLRGCDGAMGAMGAMNPAFTNPSTKNFVPIPGGGLDILIPGAKFLA